MTRRELLSAALAVAFDERLPSGTRSFSVLQLLQPRVMQVSPAGSSRLHCRNRDHEWIVERGQKFPVERAFLPMQITGPANSAVHCLVEIPQMSRMYFGTIEVRRSGDLLVPIVIMDCDVAVSSIVGAELPASEAPLQALAAQAVVSRSILLALKHPRHPCADFCDTTHCQFLRSPAEPNSTVAAAVEITNGFVVTQDDSLAAPRYGAACGGSTEGGLNAGMRYTPVSCDICRQRAIPRRGHGWGLCQEGAMGLARAGWHWQQILAKYYPTAAAAKIYF